MQASLDSKPFYLSFGIFLFLIAGSFFATLYLIVSIKLWTSTALKDTAKSITTLVDSRANGYVTSYYGLRNIYTDYYLSNPEELRLLFTSNNIKDSFGLVNYVALVEQTPEGTKNIHTESNSRINQEITNIVFTPTFGKHMDRAFTNNKPVFFSIYGLEYAQPQNNLVAIIPINSASDQTFIFVNIGFENLLNPVLKSDITKVLIPVDLEISDTSDSNNETLVFTTSNSSQHSERKSYKTTYTRSLTVDALKLDLTFRESKELNNLTKIKQIPFVITIMGLLASIASYIVIFLSLTNFKENYKRFFLLQKAKTTIK